jgi:hypothetical protein
MSKRRNLNFNKPDSRQNDRAQASTETDEALSFEDLVVDESLPSVKIKLKGVKEKHRKRKKKKTPDADDSLLTELQCEV